MVFGHFAAASTCIYSILHNTLCQLEFRVSSITWKMKEVRRKSPLKLKMTSKMGRDVFFILYYIYIILNAYRYYSNHYLYYVRSSELNQIHTTQSQSVRYSFQLRSDIDLATSHGSKSWHQTRKTALSKLSNSLYAQKKMPNRKIFHIKLLMLP